MSDTSDKDGRAPLRQRGDNFGELVAIMQRLLAPDGCPWDREQTLDKLKPFLIEEAYETLEAIESGDPKAHCEELGDLLLQVVFQSEIANETRMFDAAAVARAIDAKLVRRHPHVFGDAAVADNAFDVPAGFTQFTGPLALMPTPSGTGAATAATTAGQPAGKSGSSVGNAAAGVANGVGNSAAQGATNAVNQAASDAAASTVKKILHLP